MLPFPHLPRPALQHPQTQQRRRIRAVADEQGSRRGFGGKRYRTEALEAPTYPDRYDDFLAFLAPRLEQAHRLLTSSGSLFVHLDYREVHYVKVLLDQIFGRKSFINEIIWAYDYGGRSKTAGRPSTTPFCGTPSTPALHLQLRGH